MIFKKNSKVILHNNRRNEFATVLRTWRRKGIQYYNVKTERGSLLEKIETDTLLPTYVDINLSEKIQNK